MLTVYILEEEVSLLIPANNESTMLFIKVSFKIFFQANFIH